MRLDDFNVSSIKTANIRILCSGQDTEISIQNYDLLGTKFGFRS